MKNLSIIFLQAVVGLIGVGALVFMLGQPHLEGRNAHATLFQIYFNDPFLAFAYVASIPFFMGLFQTFKALGYARQDSLFSQAGVNSLRTIKYCAIAMIGFVAVSVVFMAFGDGEDRPQAVVMRAVILLPSIIVAVAAAVFERSLRNAAEMKSERNLAA